MGENTFKNEYQIAQMLLVKVTYSICWTYKERDIST